HVRTTVSEPVSLPVCQRQVGGAIVPRGAADGHAEGSSIFHHLVEGIEICKPSPPKGGTPNVWSSAFRRLDSGALIADEIALLPPTRADGWEETSVFDARQSSRSAR